MPGSTTSFKKLKTSRSAYMSHLAAISNEADDLASSDSITSIKVKTLLERLTKSLSSFKEVSSLIFEALDDDDDVASEIELQTKCSDGAIATQVKLESLLSRINGSPHSESSSSNYAGLPKLTLPKFDGDFMKWRPFFDQFKASVHDRDIPTVHKLTYLLGSLTNEAKSSVMGLSCTAENYSVVLGLLKERFGDPSLLIRLYADRLVNVPAAIEGNVSSFRKLIDQFEAYRREIQSLVKEVTASSSADPSSSNPPSSTSTSDSSSAPAPSVLPIDQNIFLAPILESKLPKNSRLEWARRSNLKEKFDLDKLIRFAKSEVETLESLESSSKDLSLTTSSKESSSFVSASKKFKSKNSFRSPPAAAATMSAKAHVWSCYLCDSKEPHRPMQCSQFLAMNPGQRRRIQSQKGLCENCLGKHSKDQCSSTKSCFKCGQQHHTLLHEDRIQASSSGSVKMAIQRDRSSVSIVQTALVKIRGSQRKVRILIDSGSEESYIRQELVSEIRPPLVSTKLHRIETFGGKITNSEPHSTYSIEVANRFDKFQSWISLQVIAVPFICRPCSSIPTSMLNDILRQIPENSLADEYKNLKHLPIDILLGMNAIPDIISYQAPFRINSLSLTPTMFGLVVGGTAASDQKETSMVRIVKLLRSKPIIDDVPKLWDLETIGVTPPDKLPVPSIEPQFNGVRYEVTPPWIGDERPSFSFNQALRRQSSFSKLSPDRQREYSDTLRMYHDRGILEKASPDCGNFIPHHAIVQKSKLRIVYDASAKPWKGPSLNQCLFPGPNLLSDLTTILLNFRLYKYPLIADVEKAFLMVGIKKEHRDYFKIVWTDLDHSIRVSRFCSVCFGINCGPFLLLETIRHHLSTLPQCPIVSSLKRSLYMDDVVSGSNSLPGVLDFKTRSQSIFSQAGMNLRDFRSVSDVELHWNPSPSSDVISVLGSRWDPSSDLMGVNLILSPARTKREVASSVASIFDPLGLATPWTISLRIFLQSLWERGGDWDDPLPDSLREEWNCFVQESHEIKSFFVPRFIKVDDTSELHVFGDASEKAYATVAYIKTGAEVHLLCSKARVSPLKPKSLTIPKLELMSSFLSARYSNYILSAISMANLPIRYYSDSMDVLGWMKGYSKDVFVRNRIQQIRELTSSENWSHVSTHSNAADLPSRGTDLRSFVKIHSESWLHGPSFLKESSIVPPLVLASKSKPCVQMDQWEFPVQNFSCLNRLVTAVAWYRRFIHNKIVAPFRSVQPLHGVLSVQEKTSAKISLIRHSQVVYGNAEFQALKNGDDVSPQSVLWNAHPVFDHSSNLIFCQPRNGEDRVPWIPMPSPLGVLIVRHVHHELFHMGTATTTNELLRSYWIAKCRRNVKKILASCRSCRRIQSRRLQSPEGSLPNFRSSPARAFQFSGLDHFGPILTRNNEKFWCLLFTCCVTRAVHLELVSALDVKETALAIERFFSRRGRSELLISDNGKSFIVLSKLLRGIVRWNLLVPAAPWTGGFYERLVGTIKRSCKKTLGNSSLSTSELQTVLTQLEDRVNRRPLLVLDDQSITPAHFVFGGPPPPLEAIEHSDYSIPESSPEVLSKIIRHRQITSSHLFSRWKSEYLLTLRDWKKGSKTFKPCILQVDDVVIVAPPDGIRIPRNLWPLGRITALHPGRDGKVRNVTLQMKNTFTQRPLTRLYPLECHALNPPDVTQDFTPSSDPVTVPSTEPVPSQTSLQLPSTAPLPPERVEKRTRSGRPY